MVFDIAWGLNNYNSTFFDSALNSTISTPSPTWEALFPAGGMGILSGLQISQLMFTGLETIPLMTEESSDFIKEGPRAAFGVMTTLTVLYFFIITVQPNVAPGSYLLAGSLTPGVDALATVYNIDPTGSTYRAVSFICFVLPQYLGVLAMMYAFTRQCYALARAGYMPAFMSYTRLPYTKRQEPWPPFLLCLVIATALACFACYTSTACAYIYLRFKCPDVKRPFKLPIFVGVPAAAFLFLVSLLCLCYMASQQLYQLAMCICGVKISLCFADMWIFHRKHLVLSPEEVFIQAHILPAGNNIDPAHVSNDAFEHIQRSKTSLGLGHSVDKMEPLCEEGEEEEEENYVPNKKLEAEFANVMVTRAVDDDADDLQ
ncbi:hypothetical protein HK101_002569 [Irineochytrium annulatum]|nr:hypothetical protein HK101_002569 [Irineochytrium annulatum]